MQGYTVKIYFDTKYFEFKDSNNPINFKEPNKTKMERMDIYTASKPNSSGL